MVWLYLCLAHGKFWSSGPELPAAAPGQFPDVDIVVPARDEAPTIAAVIGSLRAQDYRGRFKIILVDDNSTDGTAALAGTAANLEVISLRDKPAQWSGKLWALSRGVAALPGLPSIVHRCRHPPRSPASFLVGRKAAGIERPSW